MSEPPLRDVRTRVTRCQNRRHAMYGPPLRVERLPVPDVRTPVTRGTGACSRCTDPRYAWNECLCTMSDTPLRHVRVLVRQVTPTWRGGKAPQPASPCQKSRMSDIVHGLRLTRPLRRHHTPVVQAAAKSRESAKALPRAPIRPATGASQLPSSYEITRSLHPAHLPRRLGLPCRDRLCGGSTGGASRLQIHP